MTLVASTAAVEVGGANVTTANGLICPINVPVQIQLAPGQTLYAVTATTATLSWLLSG